MLLLLPANGLANFLAVRPILFIGFVSEFQVNWSYVVRKVAAATPFITTVHQESSITCATAALSLLVIDAPTVQSEYGHQRGFASVSIATGDLD